MTERELVARAKAGDQDAFEQLVLDNQNRIYSLAVRLTGSREEGADLAQEAFFKAWQGLDSFQGESSFSTWVYRLATNVCIDFLRRQNRRREVEQVVSLDDEERTWAEPADLRQDPQRHLERAELSRAVERGLEALPEHQRKILIMRELSGLSYQEIGQALELDLGTVKSRLARARLALRKILLTEGNLFEVSPSNQAEGRKRR
ncbi:sigma-70 family RNA polymerase sigma factor [Flavonifractor sp. An100]|uniref:RNA polymerase sigma factor n=1 Tax=Flavonifractor sp. An100 TaxID=1965538 RepID=UPI000B38C2A5|nr:sigma-70 family RNA polymerase sigma factor [Flavonifractor sp. An100]OUQ76163.1 RNA polymerase subunit sigma [Flavonifractor sp. An100]